MSNSFHIDPKEMFANETVTFSGIPVCRYHLNPNNEQRIYSTREFIRIYHFMSVLREFNHMLAVLQSEGDYHGVSGTVKKNFTPGIGREGIAVGEAYCMKNKDMLFENGDWNALIAKGLFTIRDATDGELANIVKTYADGKPLAPVSEAGAQNMTVKDLVTEYLLYGTLSELFRKGTGFNHGFAGKDVSMPPFGVYPSAQTGYAVGACLYKKTMDQDGTVFSHVDCVEDRSSYEAMKLAANAEGTESGLPILFTTVTEMSSYPPSFLAARMGAVLSKTQLHAECVNGHDPLAVIDAVARKKERMARGDGPALLEYLVASDLPKTADEIAKYGGIDDMTKWQDNDPCKLYREKLLHQGIASENELQKMDENTVETMAKIAKLALDDGISPWPEKNADSALADSVPAKENGPANGIGQFHLETPETGDLTGKEALDEPIADAFHAHKNFISLSNRENEKYHKKRSYTVQASDMLTLSMAMGYAMAGGRSLVCVDGVSDGNEMLHLLETESAKQNSVLPLPVTVLMQDTMVPKMAFSLSHVPVWYPASPVGLKEALETACGRNRPSVIFQSPNLSETVETRTGKEEKYLSVGKAKTVKEGRDITLVSYGGYIENVKHTADVLQTKYKVDAEVIELLSLSPLDADSVIVSTEKTGKAVLVGDSTAMQTLAYRVMAKAFDYLDGPLVTVGRGHGNRQADSDIEEEILSKISENIMTLQEIPEKTK